MSEISLLEVKESGLFMFNKHFSVVVMMMMMMAKVMMLPLTALGCVVRVAVTVTVLQHLM